MGRLWEAGIDNGRFLCTVDDTGVERQANLKVTVTDTCEVLLEEQVYLSYGAIFGPDVDDVRAWREKSLEAVDAWLKTHGEEPPGG